MKTIQKDQRFFVGQKALIEKGGKILVLNDPLMGLDLPGGKIQEGELDFSKALKREVREETGFEIEIKEPYYVGYFQFPENIPHRNAGKKIFIVYYKCKHKSGKLKLSEEHDGYEWVDKNTHQKLKQIDKDIYRAIEKYFQNNE